MKVSTVREIMVPLAHYATVSEDATLGEAVRTLEKAQKEFDQSRYRHRAVLVLDKDERFVGKLSQHDILRALEPKYRRIRGLASVRRFGLSSRYLESIAQKHELWAAPLEALCKSSTSLRVREIMHTPEGGEFIEEDAPVGRALHRLVIGSHHSLLVTDSQHEIVGVLRLNDVFSLISKVLQGCGA